MKSGIYAIEHVDSGRCYVGSSKRVGWRWKCHLRLLRRGDHHSPYLQNAWSKYGENAFRFLILEECEIHLLLKHEQKWMDRLSPAFNYCPLARSREGSKLTPSQLVAHREMLRARAALVTHCPKGHEYTDANTYRGKAGKRICRACNALRVSQVYASETPEQRELRRVKTRAAFIANKVARQAQMKLYRDARKETKRLYDIAYRASHPRIRTQAS